MVRCSVVEVFHTAALPLLLEDMAGQDVVYVGGEPDSIRLPHLSATPPTAPLLLQILLLPLLLLLHLHVDVGPGRPTEAQLSLSPLAVNLSAN